jgi:hypothetical protein
MYRCRNLSRFSDFLKDFLDSPFRRGCFLSNVVGAGKVQKSRIRQECENIKTCDLRDPR